MHMPIVYIFFYLFLEKWVPRRDDVWPSTLRRFFETRDILFFLKKIAFLSRNKKRESRPRENGQFCGNISSLSDGIFLRAT